MENERRTLIAIFISIMIVMLYSELILSPYTRSYVAPEATPVPSGAPNQQQSTASPNSPVQPMISPQSGATNSPPRIGSPTPAELNAQPFFTVESDKFRAKVSLLGGRLLEYKLMRYKKELQSKEPLEMIHTLENAPLPLGVYVAGLTDSFVVYRVEGATEGLGDSGRYKLQAGSDLSVKLVGTLENGTVITKTLKFSAGSYIFDVDVTLNQPTSDGSRIWLEWTSFDPHAADSSRFDFIGFISLSEDKITHTTAATVGPDLIQLGNCNWLSFANRYFMSTLIPAPGNQNAAVRKDNDLYLSRVAGTQNGGQFKLYVGPKDYTLLKSLNLQLERNIDLGWFTFLAYPLLVGLRWLYKLFGNYGLSIVLLTILIKAAFLPLTKSSFRSMSAMTKIQPEMKALRDRYKSDPTKMNQEMLALYKRHGVNPLGGCFPILIQIPVFLGLYNALLYSIELRHAPFALWITDLSAPEHLQFLGLPLPIMVILMSLMMLVQQWMTPTPDPTQKKMMMIFTVFLSFLFISFPSGLVLYWLVNNTISVVQQACIRTERALSPGSATAVVGVGLFVVAYILTIV